VEKYGGARQTTNENVIRRMRFACWITKATGILSKCNNFCFSTATMDARKRPSATFIGTLSFALET
jgi:hypothetical protein